jgi:FkbM family methyltransferase
MNEQLRKYIIKGAHEYNFGPLKLLTLKFTNNAESVRNKLFTKNNIDLVIDVGANYGQYAKSILKAGFRGQIISFEPLQEAFNHLKQVTPNYSNWKAFHSALGNFNGNAEINIAGNSTSSSLLPMNDTTINAAPESRYIGKQQIKVQKLDSIFDEITGSHQHIFLKIDTQGFEKHVLDGAAGCIQKVKGLQLEMSFDELYEGELTFIEMYQLAQDLGFSICHIEEGFRNEETGKLLQADVIFYRV